jgi:non-ribosomal peptide synthetase component F
VTRTCSEAAVGLEQATRSIRPPDSSVVQLMRARCADDRWSATAIECFATMKEGDLGRCVATLDEDARRQMFAALGGGDETAVAIARIRLADMHVGLPACDLLFATARDFLACEAVPLETRAQVGPQIAESWNLPDKLPADAQARMTAVCSQSRETLVQQAVAAGCPIAQ